VVIRLGKDSLAEIRIIEDAWTSGTVSFSFPFKCTQVEEGIDVGDYAFIWLGSDNNDGRATSWKQGLRAIGRITALARGPSFNTESRLEIKTVSIFPKSIDQFDFLEKSASHYKFFSKYPVIGVRSSRNNAIQKVKEEDRQKTPALLTSIRILFPQLVNQLTDNAPELVELLNFIPSGETVSLDSTEVSEPSTGEVWEWINYKIYQKNEKNFLFIGAPGTGKTWYAHAIAKKLASEDESRYAFVQFHPSFSYDDFIEGYAPKLNSLGGSMEYKIEPKHFLQLCERAQGDGGNLYVLVIDELSRGDPSRIFGEMLTYLEGDHRNKEFSLAYSMRKIFIPHNLIVIATANPYDRSVGELDDALIRRFTIREFPPDAEGLALRLIELGLQENLRVRIMQVFSLLNELLPNGFGHAHFWHLQSEADFLDLWKSRILFLIKRSFLFDEAGLSRILREVEDLFPPRGATPQLEGE
jgi:hypothetical protein